MLAGNLMNLRAALNAHTRLLIMEDRVERDGISYEEAAASWERDDEALSRMLQDFICITVTGRKPDLHVKAVVEIMAEFWKVATGNDITQDFAPDNTPRSPAARFIHDVLEGCAGQSISHLRGSLETHLPEESKRAAQEARAAKGRERKQAKKDAREAERRAKASGQ